MESSNLVLFSLNATQPFGERVATRLGVPLSAHEEREFEDGEHKSRPLVNVRGKDVYVLQSLYSDAVGSVNDKLCRLLFFLGCLQDAAAARVTAVVPYLGYARKDRKTQPRDPVTTRYLAALFEAVGCDRIITLDVHNLAAYQNAFRCYCDHLEATRLFVDYFATTLPPETAITVVSPDVGGMKRAEQFRQALSRRRHQNFPIAFMQKARAQGVLSIGRLVGEVENSIAIVIDDLISTGGTLLGAAKACKDQGAIKVYAAASHGVFVGQAGRLLAAEEIAQVIVTDTIPPLRLDPSLVEQKLTLLSTAGLFAEAIARLHQGGSLVDLLAT